MQANTLYGLQNCRVNGKVYTEGDTFVSDSCTGRCKCGKNGATCVALCPMTHIQCREYEMVKYYDKAVGYGSNCTCRTPFCEAGLYELSMTKIEQDLFMP